MATYFINAADKKGRINKEIYGHFSEHLGRCIYEGLYVGENSDIPNVNGMRTDVVEALKEIRIPVLRVSLERRNRSQRKPEKDDQHPLGRCPGRQQLRHT